MAEEKQEEKKEEQKAETPVEPKAVEAAKQEAPAAASQQEEAKAEAAPQAAPASTAPAKEEKKEAAPAKKEKPANCAGCKKSIRKKRWYYRDGTYYCTKRCWTSVKKKAEKPQETAAAS